MALSRLGVQDVFLNVPYDEQFKPLYLAYIVGLVELGLNPVVTLGIPGGDLRLLRIYNLIRSSRHSIHDLSRVQVCGNPRTPRFNMPFELGMAVAWAQQQPQRHTYLLFEAVQRRGHKSLSDMAGSDFNIHHGSPEGIMRELCSAFVRQQERPEVPEMMLHYKVLKSQLRRLLATNGTTNVYEARTFADIVLLARSIRERERRLRLNDS